MRRWLPLVALLALCGCGKRVTNANLAQVRPEMSAKEVESILGVPNQVKTSELTLQTQMKTLPTTTYVYEQNGKTVHLFFVGDKLVSDGGIQGTFGE